MARGTQLQHVVEMLQAECRLSTATSRGLDNRENLKELIRRTQTILYEENVWPFMKTKKEDARKTLAAGQRYYNFPTDVNPDRITKLWVQYGQNIWTPVEHGISPVNYTQRNSDNDQRADPALRWDWYGEDQFEIWPIPASDGSQLWFEAEKPCPEPVAESDTLFLDDRMIALYCAAEILAADNQKDAQAKLTLAQRRKAVLLGNVSNKQRVIFGWNQQGGQRRNTTLRAAYVQRS